MLQEFKEHINLNFPFLKDKKLLIAISGGVDSVVLTKLFHSLNYTISLAHCNFKLRDSESDLDEDFVKKLANTLKVDFYTTSFKTKDYAGKNKLSTQIAARDLRYNWFQEIIEKHNFDYVLTAHHLDDNLETFLINLTRGSGIEGFTGIPAINKNIIRPLLSFSRDVIIEYASKNNINWREDKSNASTKYTRNKIRHQIVPILKEINPSLLDSFQKTIENLQESKQIIDDKIEAESKNILTKENDLLKIDIQKLKFLSNPKAYLYQFLKTYNFTEWDDVYNLVSAQTGKQVFSDSHRLLKDREFLLLSKRNVSSKNETTYLIHKNDIELKIPINLVFNEVQQVENKNKETIYVDKDLLKYPLTIKKWDKGGYICPTGMKGTKKISKYFKDAKFSLIQKEATWLLYNATNDLIWIIGERQDRRFSCTEKTKNILKISIK